MKLQPSDSSNDFYRDAMRALQDAGVPFLIGGAYALRHHTGVVRDTKDFDVHVRERDLEPALDACRAAGDEAARTFPHWLAEVHHGEQFIDFVYRAGNGLCDVDDSWFEHGDEVELIGARALVCPAEEMVWMKAFIMERERFDGADIAHLLRSCAATFDWKRLLERFGPEWRVLFSHLILFGFIYPAERDVIPREVIQTLQQRLAEELQISPKKENLCQGTLLSREQYLPDIERWGYLDARKGPRCGMTPEDIRSWTNAISQRA